MDIRRRLLPIKKKSSSGPTTPGSYTVNLNSQWEKTTAVTNPDTSLYNGVYRSTSNYNVNSGVATMYITIKDCNSFKLYIRSYAESYSDYVMVSQLDQTITGSTYYSDTTLVKAHTRGNQQSGTAISSYTLVEFTGIPSGEHVITIVYKKDGSIHSGDDRGYVLIYKQGEGSEEGGGDVDIEGNNVITYTSSDGNIVTPYNANAFGANITSNTYINGAGIMIFDTNVTSIGTNAFRECSSLTSVTIPDSVTEIGDRAFWECSSLTSVTIPDRVTSIGTYAFYNCTSLTSVTIPDNVTLIKSHLFNGCSSLTSVTIPDNVTLIGNEAFSFCKNLIFVYCKPTTPPSIGSNIFYVNASGRKIYVPIKSVDAYLMDWSNYAQYIVGYNF